MVEVDPQVVAHLHDVRGNRGPERRVELLGRHPRRAGQQRQRCAPADHGRRSQGRAGVVGQTRHAAVEQVVQGGRQQ